MSHSSHLRVVCLLATLHCAGVFNSPLSAAEPPINVADIAAVLDINDFPRPKEASPLFCDHNSIFYETSEKIDSVLISVSDEFLKRGFTEDDSIRTHMATITVQHQSRPATIMLMSSRDDQRTHVSMHHHQGIDLSVVPRLKPVGPVDQRVDQTYYITEINVREGASILRTEIDQKKLKVAVTSALNGIGKIFVKEGVRFVCHIEDLQQRVFESENEGRSSATRVHIMARGNFDSADMPRPDDFQEVAQPYNSLFGVRQYFTDAKPADAVKRAAKALQQAGWEPADPIRESVSDAQRLLIWNGAMVQIGATGFGSGRTHVDYVVSPLPFDLPPGMDTRMVRVDTAATNLFFTTPAEVKQVADFYVDHLKALGWKAKPNRMTATPTEYRQLFESEQSNAIVLNVRSKGPESTWAEIASVGADGMDQDFGTEPTAVEDASVAMKEVADRARSALGEAKMNESREQIMALAQSQIDAALKDVPAEHAAEIRAMIESNFGDIINESSGGPAGAAESDMPEIDIAADAETEREPQAKKAPADKLAADNFPIPEGAKKVTRDFEMVTFSLDKIKDNANTIGKELAELGWKPRGEQMVESDYAYLKFQKGIGTINVTLVFDDRRSPPVHVVAQGDGLWFADSDEFGPDTADFVDREMDRLESDDEIEMPEDQIDGEQFDGDSFGIDEFDDSPSDFEGLPLPNGIDSPVTTGSQFRSDMTTSVESDLKSMVEFFRSAADDSDWKVANEKVAKEKATMTLTGGQGEMLIKLQRYEGEIEINLALRNPEQAKKHGFLPVEGKGKLMLANSSEAKIVIVINGTAYKLGPEQGGRDPKGAIKLNVLPGNYNYTIKGDGRADQTDKLRVEIGGTWALVVFPEQGHMAEQMY